MPAPIRVLELRSVWGTGGGPDKTILAGAVLTDPTLVETVVCYVRDTRDKVFAIDARARQLGLDYVEVLERHSFDHAVWPSLRALVRSRGIDIVHAHDAKTDFLAWTISLLEPIVPLSTAHGFSGDSRKERIYYAVEKRLLARFPRVIAVSQPIKAELVRTGSMPERVTVINNGIDPALFSRQPGRAAEARATISCSADDFVIGAVGRLESVKRFDVLLDAFARVRSTHPHAVLVMAGDGPLRGMLEQRAEQLGLHGSCRFLGHYTDVILLHHAFDMLVQSSVREGTPNAVLEAMALETPIVATDVGGTSELITDGRHGLLVPSLDADALAEAILRVVRNPDDAAARARAARARVEHDLSFERRVRKVETVYQELASTSPVLRRRKSQRAQMA
jgi:glycosyltransferase involved in cell wall biosynthesis